MGVWRMWESAYFQTKVWPAFKEKYPLDALKVEKMARGEKSYTPSSNFARGIWEEMKLHPKAAPPPPPPPPPPPKKLAPQTYNRGSRGQDAKYCTQGFPFINGAFVDEGGFRYDDQGLCYGGRSGAPVAGLKPSDEMDGRGPCDPYTNGNLSFPPWPAASYEV